MYRTFILILAFVLTGVVSGEIRAASLYDAVQKGNKLYQDGKFDEALKTFVDGQIESPEDPHLKYNIASAHYKMKNYEEAVKGFLDVAATARDVKLEEQSLYNCGNARYRQGKLEEAVEYYKKALELDPADQDAKHNLELVREEIKKQLNEAKDTKQKQEQQQKQQQEQKPPQPQQQNQAGNQEGQEQQKQQSQPQEQQPQQAPGQPGQKEKPQEAQKKEGGEQEAQQPREGEQQQQEQAQVPPQPGAQKDKPGADAQESQASAHYTGKMSKEEAEQLLNSIEENPKKFIKQKEREGRGGAYRPEKDW